VSARRTTAPAGDELVEIVVPIPRSALTVHAAPPDLLGQANVTAAIGITARVYLALLREFRASGGEVLEVGKSRLTDRAQFVAWLRARAGAPTTAASTASSTASEAVDGLAHELGLQVIKGGRAKPRPAA